MATALPLLPASVDRLVKILIRCRYLILFGLFMALHLPPWYNQAWWWPGTSETSLSWLCFSPHLQAGGNADVQIYFTFSKFLLWVVWPLCTCVVPVLFWSTGNVMVLASELGVTVDRGLETSKCPASSSVLCASSVTVVPTTSDY